MTRGPCDGSHNVACGTFLARFVECGWFCINRDIRSYNMGLAASHLRKSVLFFSSLTICCGVSWADDWPQWMGATRDGTYAESGIVESIPETGLPIKWRDMQQRCRLDVASSTSDDVRFFILPTFGHPMAHKATSQAGTRDESSVCGLQVGPTVFFGVA